MTPLNHIWRNYTSSLPHSYSSTTSCCCCSLFLSSPLDLPCASSLLLLDPLARFVARLTFGLLLYDTG